jgi:hypothetical protein
MQAEIVTLKTIFQNARRGLRNDPKMLIIWAISLALTIGGAWWGANSLSENVLRWQLSGEMGNMWLVLLATWGILGFLTALSVYQYAGDERATLLMTLPLKSAARFRVLFLQACIEGSGSWLLTVGMVYAFGTGAWDWTFAALSGSLTAILLATVAVPFALRYILPNIGRAIGLWFAFAVCTSIFSLLIQLNGWKLPQLAAPAPGFVAILLLILTFAGLTLLAKPFGELYRRGYLSGQGRNVRRGFDLPGLRQLGQLAARRRTLTGALLHKGLLTRGRNPLFLVRLAVFPVGLLIFGWVREIANGVNFGGVALVALYGLTITTLVFIDASPSPIGSEANRLTLFVTLPGGWGRFLLAKLKVFWFLTVLPGVIYTALIGFVGGLSMSEIGLAALVAGLALTAIVGTTTLVSTWDADMNLAIENAMQAFMIEEAPLTARRLWLLSANLTLVTGTGALLYWLPLWAIFPLLGVVCGAALIIGWRFGMTSLKHQLK